MEILIPLLLGVLVLVAVVLPLRRGGAGSGGRQGVAGIEAEIERYRAAIRSGTVCDHCLEANPEGSRFCGRCGRQIDG